MAKESTNNYDAICRSIIERHAWDEARHKVDPNLYQWVQRNSDTNPYAEAVRKHIAQTKMEES